MFFRGFSSFQIFGNSSNYSTSKKDSWYELLDKIKKRLGNWTLRPLNLPRRLVLVKFVLQSMPTFLFSTMMAPKSVLQELRNIQRKFLLSGSHDSHKWDLVKWDTVCKPKSQGGLGLHDPKIASLIAGAKI